MTHSLTGAPEAPSSEVRGLALSVVTEDNVRAIVDQVWLSLFFEAPSWAEPSSTPEDSYSSTINILGDWPATVSLTTSAEQAEQITNAMLGLHDAVVDVPVDAEDVSDAFAEMVNVVGGNLKALLPTPSTLGLPHAMARPAPLPVGPRRGDDDRGASSDPVVRVVFEWRGHPVSITVRENVAA